MKVRLLIILCLMPFCVQAQEYFTGCLISDSAYNAIPRKVTYLTRDYTIMPSYYSLKQYCPMPRRQGNNGTCTAWAIAYAARTIAEAVENNWIDREKITVESFSPLFLYARSKNEGDDCRSGAYVEKALNVMKDEGVVKFNRFSVDCATYVPKSLMQEAQQYKITGYYTLFDYTSFFAIKVDETKKAISQNKPVIIAMQNYKSFNTATTEVWNGVTDDFRGHHAMCVIGYDDNKNGGSFQLMNSWGSDWGNDGFIWVSYKDYCKNVDYAYVMDVRKKSLPGPVKSEPIRPDSKSKPDLQPIKSVNLRGELYFKLSTGEEMQPGFYSAAAIPYYQMAGNYVSGTRYRIYISNNEPAYVYVIGSDLKNSVSLVFPPDDKISPALIYQSNSIAIPDEKWYIEMDNTIGTDYVCVLYSAKDLPVHDIVEKIKNASGGFFDKVKMALAEDIVPIREINYSLNNIRFSVRGTQKSVVPVIIEIKHK